SWFTFTCLASPRQLRQRVAKGDTQLTQPHFILSVQTDILYTPRRTPRAMKSMIRAESLTDQVYSLLEREIVEGRMTPGERIREKELSQRLGISRTPIREALLKLEMAGIVVCNSRRSYNVRILTAADVSEIFEILGILEGAAVTSVAQDITQEDLELLKQYNEKMAETANTEDFHTFGAWNEKFHDVLLSKSTNHSLRDVCDSIGRR